MTKKLVTLFVLFATTALTTTFIAIPVGGGYFNFSDVAVVFSGLFIAHYLGKGKWGNLVASFLVTGLGAAAADYYLGYTIFVPVTLIAKGLESIFAYLSYGRKGISHFLFLLIGGLLMAGTYFIAEAFFLQELGGMEYAIGELFPTNTIQLIGGMIGGRVIFLVAEKIIKVD